MKDLLPAIIGGFGGAAVAVPVGWAVLKHFLEKTIDQYFQMKERKFVAKLTLEHETTAELRQKELSVYPSLSELIYRAKIAVNQLCSAKTTLELSNPDFREVCRELTTNLYGYRIYLSSELFSLVHKYKHILQDILVLTDTCTRPDNLLKDVSRKMPLETRKTICNMARETANLCDLIVAHLRQRMKQLAGSLSDTME